MRAAGANRAATDADFLAGRRYEAYLSLLCFLTGKGIVTRVVQDRLAEASLAELSLLRIEVFAAPDPLAVARRFATGQPRCQAA